MPLTAPTGTQVRTKLAQLRYGSASAPIERSLVIGEALWTVSDAGATAYDLTSLRQLAWIPFT